MTRFLALLLAVLPLPALAQEIFPALFAVVDVRSDDVLNVRAAPNASARIVGTLAPDARNVELIAAPEDGWARVNTGEAAGWVSVRYLARQPGQDWADTGGTAVSPVPLDCHGTEPFWSLHLTTTGELQYASVADTGGEKRAGHFAPLHSATGPSKRGFSGELGALGPRLIGVLSHTVCSDGMSDLLYGLSIDIVRGGSSGAVLETGCCRISR